MTGIKTFALLAGLFAASIANASQPASSPTFTLLDPIPAAGSSFQQTGANGELLITYSGVPSAASIWFSKDVNGTTDQSASTWETTIEGLLGANVNYAQQVDGAGGNSSASFTNTAVYSVLAVHFGKHELIFDFGQQIALGSVFTITTSGRAAGISNFRAYLDPLAPEIVTGVPVPGAVWLFGSSLIGLVSVVSRKS